MIDDIAFHLLPMLAVTIVFVLAGLHFAAVLADLFDVWLRAKINR